MIRDNVDAKLGMDKLLYNLGSIPVITTDEVAVSLQIDEDFGEVLGFTSLTEHLNNLPSSESTVTEDVKIGEKTAVAADSDLTSAITQIASVIEENEEVVAGSLNELNGRVETLEANNSGTGFANIVTVTYDEYQDLKNGVTPGFSESTLYLISNAD